MPRSPLRHLFCQTLLLFLSLSATALADDTETEFRERAGRLVRLCPQLAEFGAQMMALHQKGIAMTSVMKIIDKNPEELAGIMRHIVIMAYDESRADTQDAQLEATSDFKGKVELMCYATIVPPTD